MLTAVDPLPPVGDYDPGVFCRTILRRLHPGLVLGYVVTVVGVWRLLTAFLNPRFSRTHLILNAVMLTIVALFIADGVRMWVAGPPVIRSFGKSAIGIG